jgi:PAS domain S-box-containing protein
MTNDRAAPGTPPSLIAELPQQISDISRLNDDQTHPLQRILNSLPQSVFWKNRDSVYLGCNQRFARDANIASPDELIGKCDFDMPWKDQAELYRADDRKVMESGTPLYNYEEPQTQAGGNTIWLRTSKIPLRGADGAVVGVLAMYEDITDQKRAENERARLQEEIIRMQAASLAELSTPLIPISDQVVIMPLIGAIDSRRAQQVLDTLLQGIAQSGARFAILDITGVTVVDTQVANALLRAAQAVQLLGARAILTGIRPEVAQTLVGLGANLDSIITRGTLQAGIAYAIEQR